MNIREVRLYTLQEIGSESTEVAVKNPLWLLPPLWWHERDADTRERRTESLVEELLGVVPASNSPFLLRGSIHQILPAVFGRRLQKRAQLGTHECAFSEKPLSAVRQPVAEPGQVAAEQGSPGACSCNRQSATLD